MSTETGPDSEEPVVHEYDGIIEHDNQLPRWWLYTLFGAVLFAGGYWIYFHSFDLGELTNKRYQREKAAQIAEEARRIQEAGEVTPDMLVTLSKDAGTVEKGKALFDSTCVTCHAEGGKGNIGPNLTDDSWLHGGQPMDVYRSVRDGYADKQMPAWGQKLGEQKVRAAAAYVISIRNSNVPGGKAAQGEKI